MSNGKKWKMTSKQIHKQPHHRNWKTHINGGKNGSNGFKYFRHKKRFNKLMNESGHLSMSKMTALEMWYWD